MNVLLVFPPVFNPTQPYLGPFAVAGILRSIPNWSVSVFDWSLQAYKRLAEPAFIAQVAARRGLQAPFPSSTPGLSLWGTLKEPGVEYRNTIGVLEELFAWYEKAFPRTRLFRYCGMEAVDWHADASLELIQFAEVHADNLFSILYDDLLLPEIDRGDYDAIGVTLVCEDQLAAATTMAIKLRQRNRAPRLVLGGPLASMLATRSPRSKFLELFDEVYIGSASPSVKRAFAPDDFTEHLSTPAEWATPDWRSVDWDSYVAPAAVIPIHATNGCPFHCKFCSSPSVAMALDGMRFRQRPAADIVAEMEIHVSSGHRYFLLVGEMLTWSHALAVARAIGNTNLQDHVVWYFWTRLTPTPPDAVLAELRAHGCRRICFGLETLDAQALSEANKQTNRDEAVETLLRAVHADIQPHLFLMTGLPGQGPSTNEEELTILLNLLTEAGAYGISATVSPFEPEEWSPWNRNMMGLTNLTSTSRDLLVRSASTQSAEDDATKLRALLRRHLAGQPYLGDFGNVHQLVFLDRHQHGMSARHQQ
jgi:radical SAM superfamily enzyme YgiQ (UPF0313 family)